MDGSVINLCSALLSGSLFILMDHDRRSGTLASLTIYYKPFEMIYMDS